MRVGQVFERTGLLLSGSSLAGRCVGWALLTLCAVLAGKVLPYAALFDDGWAVWWPANGITLALLLITQRRSWPWILSAVTIGNVINESGVDPKLEIATVAVCNCIEVLLPALMLPPFEGLTKWLQEPRLVRNFILFAVLLGPALSSLLSSLHFHYMYGMPYWAIVRRWGISDIVGIIMYAPLVLVLISPETYVLFRWRELASTLLLFALLAVNVWWIFDISMYPLAFVISPIVLLIATRTGFSGSVLAINLIAPVATAATLHGSGPFASFVGPHHFLGIVLVQVFLILSMLMTFPISVARVQQQSTTQKLETAYRQMEALATADGLTGLANRRRFDAAFEAEWRRCQREQELIAMLMMDVDNFKAYNDSYGHPAGDTCLKAIADGLRDIPERSGDLVARYGGEEFVMMLPHTDRSGAATLAELVRSNIQQLAIPHRGNAAGVATISIGCAVMVPQERLDRGALIEASDKALYAAKQGGRNQAVFSEVAAGKTPHWKTKVHLARSG